MEIQLMFKMSKIIFSRIWADLTQDRRITNRPSLSSLDIHSLFAQSLCCWIWCNLLQPPPVCLKVSASGKQSKSHVINVLTCHQGDVGWRHQLTQHSADSACTLDGGSVSFGMVISGNLRNGRRKMLACLHTADGDSLCLLNVWTYFKCL